jgi:hypothetical protein
MSMGLFVVDAFGFLCSNVLCHYMERYDDVDDSVGTSVVSQLHSIVFCVVHFSFATAKAVIRACFLRLQNNPNDLKDKVAAFGEVKEKW